MPRRPRRARVAREVVVMRFGTWVWRAWKDARGRDVEIGDVGEERGLLGLGGVGDEGGAARTRGARCRTRGTGLAFEFVRFNE